MNWIPDRTSAQPSGFTVPLMGELAATPLCVLVLDDDVDSSAWVAVLLTSRGHTVRQVATGAAYREALTSWPADVVLLDMIRPTPTAWSCSTTRAATIPTSRPS